VGLAPLAVPIVTAALLVALASLIAMGAGLRRPIWATLPGVGLLSFGLLVLPFRMVRAGGGGGGPSPGGSHGELFLAYLPDHLGTTKGVVDVFGNLEEARDYDPFGRSIAHTGDLALKNRFTGQPEDEGDGLYDYGARMYNPEWGRFISPDPHVQSFDSQGINRYAYVGNQPTSRVDPTGNLFGGGAASIVAAGLSAGSLGSMSGLGGVTRLGGGRVDNEAGRRTLQNPLQQFGLWKLPRRVEGGRPNQSRPSTSPRATGGLLQEYYGDLDAGSAGVSVPEEFELGDLIDFPENDPDGLVTEAILNVAIYAVTVISIVRALSAVRSAAAGRAALGADDAARYSARQLQKFERQLKEHGRRAVEKSKRSIQRRLDEHRRALERYKEEGGYTSSVEREIANFEDELQAIDKVLGGNP
jgi:RHS repeat-associated protein